MFKKLTSIFFTVLLIGVISAPTIISALDNSVDISILFSFSEEEEEIKNLEIVNANNCCEKQISDLFVLNPDVKHTLKNYPNPYLNLISPPPESAYFL